MEYKKAAEIRNKGLLSLIAENKFREGKGLGASIGGAISQKFKAKATGIKESFDPLNIVRKMTGKGTFGRIATTIAGRAMGKSEKDISYFGGYTKKVKHHYVDTNVSPLEHDGEYGGSAHEPIAGILSEMYQFMQQTHEVDKKDYEIQQAFLEEQNSDAETRHKQLVRAIKKYVKVPTKEAEKTEGSGMLDWIMNFVNKIKDGIMASLGPIFKFLSGPVFGFLTGSIFSSFMSLLSGANILSNLTKLLLRMPAIAAGAGPFVVMAAVTDWLAPTNTGGNTQEQTDLLKDIHEKSGFKPTTTDVVPEEDLKGKPMVIGRDAYEARKKRIQDSFELGRTYSTEDADRIKKAYNIDVPKELVEKNPETKTIQENKKTTVPVSEKTSSTSKETKTTSSSVPAETTALVPTSLPKSTTIPQQTADNTESNSGGQPVVAMNSTTNNIGGGPAKIFNMDSIKVRNSDLNRYLFNSSQVV